MRCVERDAALGELQTTVEELRVVEAKSTDQDAALLALQQTITALQDELAQANMRAGRAETRAIEIERRADDLGAGLERVHTEATTERERQAALAQLTRQFEAVRQELTSVQRQAQALEQEKTALDRRVADQAKRSSTAEAERDRARQEAAAARESVARLQGQIEAMTAQHAVLLQTMTAHERDMATPKAPRKKTP